MRCGRGSLDLPSPLDAEPLHPNLSQDAVPRTPGLGSHLTSAQALDAAVAVPGAPACTSCQWLRAWEWPAWPVQSALRPENIMEDGKVWPLGSVSWTAWLEASRGAGGSLASLQGSTPTLQALLAQASPWQGPGSRPQASAHNRDPELLAVGSGCAGPVCIIHFITHLSIHSLAPPPPALLMSHTGEALASWLGGGA